MLKNGSNNNNNFVDKQTSKRQKVIKSFGMPCFAVRTSPKVEAQRRAMRDALNTQRLLVLFKDVENLIELSRLPFTRGSGRILQRIDQCIDKMDEVAKEVVLEQAQMRKFLDYRKNLEKLALEVTSNEIVFR